MNSKEIEEIIEILDRYDKDYTLQSGEVIQAISFYDFVEVAKAIINQPQQKEGFDKKDLERAYGKGAENGDVIPFDIWYKSQYIDPTKER